ncbi:MAG TPA: hypothetical protein VFW62_11615 [bacterium]|nr:hypothetical protein [bacterium]
MGATPAGAFRGGSGGGLEAGLDPAPGGEFEPGGGLPSKELGTGSSDL